MAGLTNHTAVGLDISRYETILTKSRLDPAQVERRDREQEHKNKLY